MPINIRILIIEDEEDDLYLVLRAIRRGGFEPEYTCVETSDQMRSNLENREWDIVLSDYSLPNFSAHKALEALKKTSLDIPFIVISGAVGEETTALLMQHGAHDCINKNHLHRLCPAIKRELKEVKTRKYKKQIEAEKYAVQEQLKENNKKLKLLLNEKNELLGMASHDLRHPIGVIQNFSEILLDNSIGPLNEDQEKFVSHINKASIRLLRLLEDLLSLSTIESGTMVLKKEEFNFSELLGELLDTIRIKARNKKIEILVSNNGPGKCKLNADINKLYQVLHNLIGNAVNYSPQETTIKIDCQMADNELSIKIKDQGVGIPPDDIKNLFQPFYKANNKTTAGEASTGLGLFIAKRIIDAHNGSINVSSEVGVGSTFSFNIPTYISISS